MPTIPLTEDAMSPTTTTKARYERPARDAYWTNWQERREVLAAEIAELVPTAKAEDCARATNIIDSLRDLESALFFDDYADGFEASRVHPLIKAYAKAQASSARAAA